MKHTHKRILSIYAAAALSVCSMPQGTPLLLRPAITASAAETCGTCGENCTWTLDSEGTLTISGNGIMTDYYHDDMPWARLRGDIKAVDIKKGVTSIGESAFYQCKALTAVSIPEGVTSIGNDAFNFCQALTSVTIPEGVTSIGEDAFYLCESLSSVTIPDSVTNIEREAFRSSAWLKNEQAKNPLVIAGKMLVNGQACSGAVTIPDGVQYIANNAFEPSSSLDKCNDLISVTMPDSVTEIGREAFKNCEKLTEVKFSNGLTSIPPSAFEFCKKLDNIVIPDSVTTISNYAFSECAALNSVTIPESVTEFGQCVFQDSPWLADRQAENAIVTVNGIVIDGKTCKGDVTVPDGVKGIAYGSFMNCKDITSVTLPDGLSEIGDYAFGYCSGLDSITIPQSVDSISEDAFYNCKSLTFKGYAETYAETYANEHDIPFESLGDAPETPVNDWAEKSVISKNTEEAELVVRVGDIDACNDESAVADHGYDPFTAKSQYAHGYPWLKDETDPAGTDRIFVGSKWNGESTDGYSSNYADFKKGNDTENAYGDGALSFTMEYDASEIEMKNVILQLCIDDFQANSWDSVFTVTLNGKDAPFIAELLNHTDQTGPTAYIVSAMIPAGFFADIASGKLTVVIDETTGVGDGYAIDFAKLLINYDDQIFTGTFSGKTEPGATVRLLGTSTTVAASSTGEFTFSAIPGINAVRSSKDGFVEKYESGIVLSAGTEWKPALSLEEGQGTPDIDFSNFAETGLPQKGDLDSDGEISVEDAQLALLAYVQTMAGLESGLTEQQTKAADINGDHTVSVEDAQMILIYYVSNTLSGQNVTWDELLGK